MCFFALCLPFSLAHITFSLILPFILVLGALTGCQGVYGWLQKRQHERFGMNLSVCPPFLTIWQATCGASTVQGPNLIRQRYHHHTLTAAPEPFSHKKNFTHGNALHPQPFSLLCSRLFVCRSIELQNVVLF